MISKGLFSAAGAAEIDRLAIESYGHLGLELMRAAGEAAFREIVGRMDKSETRTANMLVVCGSGNNGGDGYVVARCALEAGWPVTLVRLGAPKSKESKQVCQDFATAGGVVSQTLPLNEKDEFDVVVDAIFGIGLSRAPAEPHATVIRHMNSLSGFKVALDVPSGLDATSGEVFDPCFSADLTVTFIVEKAGLLTGGALDKVGYVELEELGVEERALDHVTPIARRLSPQSWPARRRDSHKGSYGHLLLVGANTGMLGAGLLAGEAALRTGCGKATLVSSDPNLSAAMVALPELMSRRFESSLSPDLAKVDAVAVGPGLGTGDIGGAMLQACLILDKPSVIDADGLNLLCDYDKPLPSSCVLTPHPAEAARLLGINTRQIQSDRLNSAAQIARKFGAVCVLKGAGTVIADVAGDLWICAQGNPAMATAGMGDVLTGIIGALLAQGVTPLEAAKLGVYQHALAADDLVSNHGKRTLLASDVARHLSVSRESSRCT